MSRIPFTDHDFTVVGESNPALLLPGTYIAATTLLHRCYRKALPYRWRVVWQYRRKRAMRDEQTLNIQRNLALAIVDGEKPAKKAPSVKVTGEVTAFGEKAYERAMKLFGFKGYVTNFPVGTMTAVEVIGRCHDLWRVEQSFRMSKTDL
ncbi:hypothetical protein KTJ89_06820 [Brevibacterium sediminis]|uniref:hypothetical protein n=1 Tax=Brevibacterium sediminis TaxID=1857024 RepID=UPI0021755E44|nr:hypothetical protein [Brevibacterium sediminis]MCS4592694.1 hypothetical protein [Brevibacterium sediminis]